MKKGRHLPKAALRRGAVTPFCKSLSTGVTAYMSFGVGGLRMKIDWENLCTPRRTAQSLELMPGGSAALEN